MFIGLYPTLWQHHNTHQNDLRKDKAGYLLRLFSISNFSTREVMIIIYLLSPNFYCNYTEVQVRLKGTAVLLVVLTNQNP
jgi:hypothetical protein